MSTKNLARTVIEGGRYRGNRWDRRHSNKSERAAERCLSNRIHLLDVDGALYEPRTPVRASFRDKLAPAERWMRSQVGRPWNKVRGELMQRFDTRTTAGRHIVFDHLLRSVQVDEVAMGFRWFDFKVDRRGTLRELKRTRYQRPRLYPALPEPESELLGWLETRRVGERDTHLYWFVPTPAGAFRQASPLEAADAARWRSLPEWFRQRWDAFVAPPCERSI
jgi:hypothetical protein